MTVSNFVHPQFHLIPCDLKVKADVVYTSGSDVVPLKKYAASLHLIRYVKCKNSEILFDSNCFILQKQIRRIRLPIVNYNHTTSRFKVVMTYISKVSYGTIIFCFPASSK